MLESHEHLFLTVDRWWGKKCLVVKITVWREAG